MSLLGSFSRTQSGSSLHKKPTTASIMTALCPRRNHLSTSNPFDQDSPRHRRDLHILSRRPAPPPSRTLTPESAESLFLEALSRASLCRKHARHSSTIARPSPSKNCPSNRSARFTTTSPTKTPPQSSAVELLSDESSHSAPIHTSRHELRSIVDQYDYAGYQEDPPPNRDSYHDESPPTTHVHYASQIPAREPLVAQSTLDQEAIDYFNLLLQDKGTPNAPLYKAYKAIPQPRPQYLQNDPIRSLMHRLGVVEFKDEQTMQRYLSVVDDMLTADVSMTRSEWNSAMSFAGRYLRKVGDVQVETATQIWLRMENEAGITSSATTFSILFDVATKAGKFALADVVVKEMMQRQIEPNRYFRTNIIYCHGLKRDGAAVRKAYQDFVDAGEIIDTLVLNCVIVSLINAGEPSAAEYIFEKMKALGSESATTANIKGWKAQRHLGKVLDRAGKTLREEPKRRVAVQNVTPITPNLHTYRLLIKYHAHESGNIDRISELLDEMQQIGIQIHGSIFYQIIRGFSIHGGIRYSSWNKKKLDSFWEIFCQFVERDKDAEQQHGDWISEEDRGCYLSISMVKIVLDAYHKVTGPENTRKMWEEIKEVWKPNEQDEEYVNSGLEYNLARS
jgi:pentatricopeptide repeat protein